MRVRTTLVAATAVLLTAALAAPAAATAAGHGHAGTLPRSRLRSTGGTLMAMDAAVAAGVPGVTATAEDGHGAWSATAGVGDTGTGRPRSAADRYRVGSITKTFVATVLLQLEAEGRLSLDDTVDKWQPGVVRGHGHDGRHITVRQLLNHTSGVFDYTRDTGFYRAVFTEDGFFRHRYDTHTPGELVRIAMRHRPDFPPGTSWKYSNTNYVLAGMVIEKVTGHPYATEIERRIIAPLRLRGTSLPGTRVTVPRPSSRSYSKFTDPKSPAHDVTQLNPSLASAAGEMISDSADLDRFYSALLRGKLLPPRQLAEMKTTVEATGIPGARYGLGIMDRRLTCGVHVWGHDGGIHGSRSSAVTTADGEHAIAFNFNGDWAGDPESVIDGEFC
jgi:D-alanyl-D-alanine carboxypeptidase